MTTPHADVRILERLTATAPLGVRFWDVATRAVVTGGMHVTAVDTVDPRLSWRALENGSGISVLSGLRGLREIEQSDGSPTAWREWAPDASPRRARAFQLVVRDPRDRFQPFTCLTDAPQRLFADWACPPASPSAEPYEPDAPTRSLPVFSAPARAVPGGFAVVRAQLAELGEPPASPPAEERPRAAAWAFVEVRADEGDSASPGRATTLGASYADAQGRVAVMFPWPAPPRAALLSPPSPPAGGVGLFDARWRLRLVARYDRLDSAAVPDLCAVLSQRPATLWDEAGVPLNVRELAYGRELVVRSEGPGGARLSVLLITPGS